MAVPIFSLLIGLTAALFASWYIAVSYLRDDFFILTIKGIPMASRVSSTCMIDIILGEGRKDSENTRGWFWHPYLPLLREASYASLELMCSSRCV